MCQPCLTLTLRQILHKLCNVGRHLPTVSHVHRLTQHLQQGTRHDDVTGSYYHCVTGAYTPQLLPGWMDSLWWAPQGHQELNVSKCQRRLLFTCCASGFERLIRFQKPRPGVLRGAVIMVQPCVMEVRRKTRPPLPHASCHVTPLLVNPDPVHVTTASIESYTVTSFQI